MNGRLRAICWIAAAILAVSPGIAGAASVGSLADAAERGDSERVQHLLTTGSDPDASQVDGMTALHWAAHRDDLATAKLLVESGASAQVSSRYGVTPLSLACVNGNRKMVHLLLDAGADPNATLRGGETALMTAARTGKLGPVKALLDRGADVEAREAIGRQSALMWAVAEGHADVVRELVRAGANIHARLASGFTPLLFAAREGRIDALRELLEAGADPNDTIRPPPDEPSRARGYKGAPPFGASALLVAVENAHFELATNLLDAGANPNAAIPGYTVLHAIARVRKPGLGDNDPPPQGSGSVSSLDFVREIVRRGADLNARMAKHVNLGNTRLRKLGATPYFLAAQSADADLMRTLASIGADVRIPNSDNSTPLMAAAGLGTRSPGEDAGTEPDVLEAVGVAMELGADINAVDDNGETVMHGAAYKNLPKVVEYLAANGADITVWNTANRFGWTPLAIATGYRFGNFKPSQVTIDAIRRVMLASGVLPPEDVKATTQQIY